MNFIIKTLHKVLSKIKDIKLKLHSEYYRLLFNAPKSFTIYYPIRLISGFRFCKIGKNFIARSNLRLEVIQTDKNLEPKLTIGDNVQFNDNVHIGCTNYIYIGNNVLIASNVFITDHNHGFNNSITELKIPPFKRQIVSKGGVIINENCWLGENVSILPNVSLGKNCIVGSNSVVTKSFPDNSIIAGNPAKIIKQL